MDDGAAEREALLRNQMKVVPPERFEQLVFELAHREDTTVRRIQHPDGGADTIRPAAQSVAEVVWQAKRYGGTINWGECEQSLEASVVRWKPARVIFVFARDLSEKLELTFDEKLVRPGAEQGVEVTPWTASELVRRLDDNPDIRRRFFGAEQESTLDKLDRMIKSGGKLEDSQDLVERAKTLSQFAESRDRAFTYSITSAGRDAPAATGWEELPYLQMEVSGSEGRVEVATWPRDGAEVETPSVSFAASKAGEDARLAAMHAWARGDEAVINEGATLRFQAPAALRELVPDPSVLGSGRLRMPAPKAYRATLTVRGANGEENRDLEVRAVPPRVGAFGALAGLAGSAFVEVNLSKTRDGELAGTFTFSADFGPEARTNRDAAALIYAFCTHEELTFRADVLPDVLSGAADVPKSDACREMEERLRFYDDLVLLEDQLGVEPQLPDEIFEDDVLSAGAAADVLRTGEGVHRFERTEGIVSNPADIPRIAEDLRRTAPERWSVTQSLDESSNSDSASTSCPN